MYLKLLHSYFRLSWPPRAKKACRQFIHASKSWLTILGNKAWFLFFCQTTKTCEETLFDWLIILCLVWITKQDFIVYSQSHSLEASWSPTTRGQNFMKSNLASDLFHGYKDLAWQSSWWSILFRVYVYIHWSKAVALFAQFLSSLLERNSTNKRRPWQNYMPRVQKTVSDFWKWKSQRTSH